MFHKAKLLLLFIAVIGINTYAQRIQVGSYTFKDGAVYCGELASGKPNGRGTTKFPNGDF